MKVTLVTTCPCHLRALLLGGENAEGFHLKVVDLLNRPFYDHEASAKGYCLESICCLADDDQATLWTPQFFQAQVLYPLTLEFDQENSVFVCSLAISCCTVSKHMTLVKIYVYVYTNDVPEQKCMNDIAILALNFVQICQNYRLLCKYCQHVCQIVIINISHQIFNSLKRRLLESSSRSRQLPTLFYLLVTKETETQLENFMQQLISDCD